VLVAPAPDDNPAPAGQGDEGDAAGNGAAAGDEAADDIGELARGINPETKTFDSVADAKSLSKFMLNKVGGVTSEVGLEVGSKALGGLGGAYSAEQGIQNLVDSNGKDFLKKGESGMSKVSDVGNMVGAALDMASIALPVLAPFALATNLVSAGLGTIGTLEDDGKKISDDSAPPSQQTLSVHPAWAGLGMVASRGSVPQVS